MRPIAGLPLAATTILDGAGQMEVVCADCHYVAAVRKVQLHKLDHGPI